MNYVKEIIKACLQPTLINSYRSLYKRLYLMNKNKV